MRRIFLLLLVCALWGTQAHGAVTFDPEPMRQNALRLLDEGRVLESVDAWATVYTYAPYPEQKAHALVTIGDIYALFLEQRRPALEVYRRAIQEFPRQQALANAWFNSGMLLYELGKLPEAQASFGVFIDRYRTDQRESTARYMYERIGEERRKGETVRPDIPQQVAPIGKEPWIRVVLTHGQQARFTLPAGGKLTVGGNSQPLPAGTYFVQHEQNAVALAGRRLGPRATITCQRFSMGKKQYVGEISLSIHKDKLLLVNKLPLETYLDGVVPKEMSPSFAPAALMAQAVAARSYAWYLVSKSADKPYDVAATTASQVYGGADVGNAQTQRAVSQTRGQMLAYNGKVVLSYFHSHSGGMLEDDKLVWTADMPYYDVVEDTVSNRAKRMGWSARISRQELAQKLASKGFGVRTVTNVRPETRSKSGRLVRVAIDSPTGSFSMKANTFRLMVGATSMKSTLCDVGLKGDTVTFSGKGYGHGVGMSQWGAEGMAREGRDYRQILGHYYPGTSIEQLY